MKDCVSNEELTILPAKQFGCSLDFNSNYGGLFDNSQVNTNFVFNEDNALKILGALNQMFPEVKEFRKLIDFHIKQKC